LSQWGKAVDREISSSEQKLNKVRVSGPSRLPDGNSGPALRGGIAEMARWPIALAFLIIGGLAGALVTTTGLRGQVPAPPPVFPKELTSYRDVVKRVLPAVVSIESKPVARK